MIEFARTGLSTLGNGILLRCDLHSLLDAGGLAIDPTSMEARFTESARRHYKEFERRKVAIPKGGPASEAFRERWLAFDADR